MNKELICEAKGHLYDFSPLDKNRSDNTTSIPYGGWLRLTPPEARWCYICEQWIPVKGEHES